MHTRRSFLQASALTAGVLAAPTMAMAQAPAGGGTAVQHQLPPLPYANDALEPFMDAKTVELHHDKHHAGYVKNLNTAEQALAEARAAKDFKMVQHWSRNYAFNAAGANLHALYWATMAPPKSGGGGQPEGALAEQIAKDFGGFDAFKGQFSAAAVSVEASGWAALHYDSAEKRLLVLQIENHQKLTPWHVTPLIVVDVWEHAYYLKYNNKRDEFVAAWWNLVNWPQVAKNFDAQRA